MFEEEDNRDNADEDPTPTQNDAAQNDPKKKKTPAKKSPAMKVAMPDSTERVSTSYQVATTARKTSKKSATKKGGPRLTKKLSRLCQAEHCPQDRSTQSSFSCQVLWQQQNPQILRHLSPKSQE
jgi:hypothetical protein